MFKKIALGLVAFIFLYALLVIGTAASTNKKEDAFQAELNRLATLGDGLKLEPSEIELGEACAKLPRVDRLQLIAYFPAPAEGLITDEDAQSRYGKRRVFGVELGGSSNGLSDATLPMEGRELTHWIFEFSSDFPMYWDLYRGWAFRPLGHDSSDLKYVVVHQLESIDLPYVSGNSYSPGHMRFRSAVMDPQGKVLCAGSSALDQSGTVQIAGSGRTKADAEEAMEASKEKDVRSMFFIDMDFFALRPVCSLGGQFLCEKTFGTFVPP